MIIDRFSAWYGGLQTHFNAGLEHHLNIAGEFRQRMTEHAFVCSGTEGTTAIVFGHFVVVRRLGRWSKYRVHGKVGRQYSDALRSPSFASEPILPPALIFADRLLLFERQFRATFRNRMHGL
jgi:hypothetical protein